MKKLIKKYGKEFKILNLTDLHMDDALLDEDGAFLRILNKTLDTLVERVKPDLITITGDLAWGGHYEGQKYIVKKLDTYRIPWAPVFGNHDQDAGDAGLVKFEELMLKSEFCIYAAGDRAYGYGNYVVKVEEELTGKPIEGLIFLDSHRIAHYTNEKGEPSSDWARLWENQIEWYSEQTRELKKLGYNETSVFLHIPPYGYREAFSAAFKEGAQIKDMLPPHGTKECFNEGYEGSLGVCYEGICSHPVDDGVLDAMLKSESTRYILCGHDHVNNWMVNYKGINFIYTLKTGCGCYWVPCLSGGTVLTLDRNGVASVEHEYVIVPAELCRQL